MKHYLYGLIDVVTDGIRRKVSLVDDGWIKGDGHSC
jgi:hypothetical protein